jgi:hypothetical protein
MDMLYHFVLACVQWCMSAVTEGYDFVVDKKAGATEDINGPAAWLFTPRVWVGR